MTKFLKRLNSALYGFKQCIWFSLKVLLVAVFVSSGAVANEFELSRLASEIRAASSYLAQDLRYSRGFGSVGARADRLARDSAQLVDAISRRRSASNIRAQYADVSERYDALEDAFFRASRNYSNEQVFNQMHLISMLFSDLSAEYYYSPFYNSRTSVITIINPRIPQSRTTIPNVFRNHSNEVDRRHGYNYDSETSNSVGYYNKPDGSTPVQRFNSVEGHSTTGHRIIRSRTEGMRNTRRRDN